MSIKKHSNFNKEKSQILHLGSGNTKIKGAISLDMNARVHPDVIHNLNTFPYPFKKNQFNKIIADNIFEHLNDIPKILEEIYRISKPGAQFRKTKVVLEPQHVTNPIVKMILFFINRNAILYEKRFTFIFPVGVISYELEVIK